MEPVSVETIEKILGINNSMEPGDIQKVFDRLLKEQPVLVEYLMGGEDAPLGPEVHQLLLYLGSLVWLIMAEGKLRLPQITEDMLIKAEDGNLKWVKDLGKKPSGGQPNAFESALKEYPQPEVLSFVFDALEQEQEEGSVVKETNMGVMLIQLKTEIDCLNSSIA